VKINKNITKRSINSILYFLKIPLLLETFIEKKINDETSVTHEAKIIPENVNKPPYANIVDVRNIYVKEKNIDNVILSIAQK